MLTGQSTVKAVLCVMERGANCLPLSGYGMPHNRILVVGIFVDLSLQISLLN